MKKQNILLGMLLASISFFSCEQEQIEESFATTNAGKEISFNIGISSLTRTVTIGNKTTFIENDQLGLFESSRENPSELILKNLGYTYKNNQWDAEKSITFPVDGSAVNFYGYYPYSASAVATTFEHTVAADQSVDDAYDKSDLLLTSHTSSTADDTSITLIFNHKLALVEVTLPSGKVGISAEIKAKRTATVDLLAQTATLREGEGEGWVTMKKVGEAFRAVVPAQTLSIGHLIRVKLKEGGYYHYTAKEGITLTANKINTFNMTDETSGND